MSKPVITWRERRQDGESTGLEAVVWAAGQPYMLEVSNEHVWQVWTYAAGDVRSTAAGGTARSRDAAKRRAEGAAKRLLEPAQDAEDAQTAPTPAWLLTLRMYALATLAVLATAYAMMLWVWLQPLIASAALGILAAGTWAAHRVLVFFDDAGKRRERLAKASARPGLPRYNAELLPQRTLPVYKQLPSSDAERKQAADMLRSLRGRRG